MNEIIIATAVLLSSLLTYTHLQATNSGAYISVIGGSNTQNFSEELANANKTDLDMSKGYMYIGAIGYKFNEMPFKVEGEVAYRNTSVNSFKAKKNIENIEYYTLIVNLYYDIEFGGAFTPYIGIGAGQAINKEETTKDIESLVKSDKDFTSQVIAGVSIALCEKTDIGVDYRYLRTDKNIRDNSLTINLRRFF